MLNLKLDTRKTLNTVALTSLFWCMLNMAIIPTSEAGQPYERVAIVLNVALGLMLLLQRVAMHTEKKKNDD